MKQLLMIVCLLITAATFAQTTNQQPKTKPDTIIVHLGTSTAVNVLLNDTDFEGDSLRCSGNALRNGTTVYPIDKWLVLPTCSIMLTGKGSMKLIDKGVLGTITTISYLVKDGKHTNGIVGKVVIKIVEALPLDPMVWQGVLEDYNVFSVTKDTCRATGSYHIWVDSVEYKIYEITWDNVWGHYFFDAATTKNTSYVYKLPESLYTEVVVKYGCKK